MLSFANYFSPYTYMQDLSQFSSRVLSANHLDLAKFSLFLFVVLCSFLLLFGYLVLQFSYPQSVQGCSNWCVHISHQLRLSLLVVKGAH